MAVRTRACALGAGPGCVPLGGQGGAGAPAYPLAWFAAAGPRVCLMRGGDACPAAGGVCACASLAGKRGGTSAWGAPGRDGFRRIVAWCLHVGGLPLGRPRWGCGGAASESPISWPRGAAVRLACRSRAEIQKPASKYLPGTFGGSSYEDAPYEGRLRLQRFTWPNFGAGACFPWVAKTCNRK